MVFFGNTFVMISSIISPILYNITHVASNRLINKIYLTYKWQRARRPSPSVTQDGISRRQISMERAQRG